eukprot:gene1372-1733_t
MVRKELITKGAIGSMQAPRKLLSGFKDYLQSCWAHARRHFEQALSNDQVRAELVLQWIQGLYKLEAKARKEGLNATQRKDLREEAKNTLLQNQLGKAMRYAIDRWEALSAYLYDGTLESVALGRKNYLFAGSHQAAQRAAMIYSFFAICKKHQINPFEWLKYTLETMMTIKYQNITQLYHQNYKKLIVNMYFIGRIRFKGT